MFVAYSFGYGMKATACTLVGNNIGSGDYKGSKRYFNITLLFTLMLLCFEITVLYIKSEFIIGLLTPLETLRNTIRSCYPLLLLSVITDCMKGTLQGAIRGLGLQDQMVPYHLSFGCVLVTIGIYYCAFSLGLGI